jgi:hypothetical protein
MGPCGKESGSRNEVVTKKSLVSKVELELTPED